MSYFAISPDGARIVYSTCKYVREWPSSDDGPRDDLEFELETVNIDGTDARRLTKNDTFENYPDWSPDGGRIAFVSGGGLEDLLAKRVHIHSMAADGTDRRVEAWLVARHPPQWSPDGERIAYVGRDEDEGRAIYVIGAGEPLRITDAVSGPTWSPDGERIAYAKVDGDEVALYTIAADGTDARRLTAIDGWQPGYGELDPSKAWINKVSWSPDRSKILFLVNNVDYDRLYSEVHVIGPDGGGLARVTVRKPLPDSISDAAWSPDGTRIAMVGAFGSRRSNDPAKSMALVTVAVDGTDLRVLVGRQDDGQLVGLGVVRGDISAHVAACGDGVAVAEPEANPGLVEDCAALLEVQNAVAGPDGLNWFVEWSMSEWEGVVVEGSPPRVTEIALAGWGLAGEVPTELSRLTGLRVLAMSNNALMGKIPAELGDLTNLERLDLSGNYLSGEIPAKLGELSGLASLSLGGNNLKGEIPPELGELKNLKGLNLSHNYLSGEIPAELGRLSGLGGLDLSRNRLAGKMPAELGQLTGLEYLNLVDNELTGEIPAELGRLSELTNMNLSHNHLTGDIPVELGQLTGLRVLDLSDNELAGDIPAEVGELKNLEDLMLHKNQLSGAIPGELGELKNMEELSLYENRLSGAIPADLARLTDLDELYLSGNELTGCIPEGLKKIRYNDLDALELPDCE